MSRAFPGTTAPTSGWTGHLLPSPRWLGTQRAQDNLEQEIGAREVEALARQRLLRWCAVAGLTWRALAYPPALLQALHEGDARLPSVAVAPLGMVLIGNVALLLGVLWTGSTRLLERRWFCGVDIGIAATLNLWSAVLAAPGTILVPYQDVFAVYAWDTVVLWTAVRGPLFGLWLCLGTAVPLQLGMALLNGHTLGTIAWGTVGNRALWVLAHFLIAAVVMVVAREAAWATAAAALRAGHAAERAEMLRKLHDTVLQTLEGIALQASHTGRSAEERLQIVSTEAARQSAALRAALDEDTSGSATSLVAGLRSVCQDAAGAGLRVELVIGELDGLEVKPPAREALLGAVREACTNISKHAGVRSAVIRAVSADGGFQITVRDHGRGFDPAEEHHGFGIEHSMVERLAAVGGRAQVSSTPGRGTKVTLWTPAP